MILGNFEKMIRYAKVFYLQSVSSCNLLQLVFSPSLDNLGGAVESFGLMNAIGAVASKVPKKKKKPLQSKVGHCF